MSMPSAVRHINQTRVLRLLQAAGPLSRAEIARRLEIMRSTAGSLVVQLKDAGALRDVSGFGGDARERLVGRPGARVVVATPHYTDFSSFCDPTHRWHLNSFSLRYFGDDHAGFDYYSKVRFREISTRVTLLALWRYLGFELLVNAFPRFRRFWEFYLCYIIRGKAIEWELEIVK